LTQRWAVGAGASLLDGLVRIDLSRGLRAPREWRLDMTSRPTSEPRFHAARVFDLSVPAAGLLATAHALTRATSVCTLPRPGGARADAPAEPGTPAEGRARCKAPSLRGDRTIATDLLSSST
jgi:hypothetical protein